MATLYDADISGTGAADLVGGTNVSFFLLHLTSLGGLVRRIEDYPDDRLLRAGAIAFGRTLTLIGGVSRDYWQPPIFIDWEDFRWIPQPNQNNSVIMQIVATRVRWVLSTGVAGHLYVNGS